MDKVTIADSAFLPYGKSASLGSENPFGPTHFEWEYADPQMARFVTDGNLKYARGEGQIAWLLEPFFLHPEDYLTAMEKKFDFVLTHNMNFVTNKNWLYYDLGGSWIPFEKWRVYNKTKNVSLISTYKTSMIGHRLRREAAEKYADRLDVFGGTPESIARKFDCLADYRYSVVIESEKTPYFFNEKLIDCFAVGTIPIYWGCPIRGTLFDPAGIIQVRNVDEIGDILEKADKINYESRLPAVRENLETAKQYRITEDWIFNKYPFLFGK